MTEAVEAAVTADTPSTETETSDLRASLVAYLESDEGVNIPKSVTKTRTLKKYTFEVPYKDFTRMRADAIQSREESTSNRNIYKGDLNYYLGRVTKFRATLATGTDEDIMQMLRAYNTNHMRTEYIRLKEYTYHVEAAEADIEGMKDLTSSCSTIRIADSHSVSERLSNRLERTYQDILNRGDMKLIKKYLTHIQKFDMVKKYNKQLIECSIKAVGTAEPDEADDLF